MYSVYSMCFVERKMKIKIKFFWRKRNENQFIIWSVGKLTHNYRVFFGQAMGIGGGGAEPMGKKFRKTSESIGT